MEPRDYHKLSDSAETLFHPSEPENLQTIVTVSHALAELLAEIDAGDCECD